MAKQVNRFSDAKVKALRKPGRHADGNGLFLIIAPGNAPDAKR